MASTALAAQGISISKPAPSPWMIAVSVMLATFMEVLDTSIASVALPYIAGSLRPPTTKRRGCSPATWSRTPSCSRPVRGSRCASAASAFSSPASSSSPCRRSPAARPGACRTILIARAVQGAGGGALQPLSQAILLESFPPDKRGSAMAVFALGVVVAPVLGPTLGGYLTDTYSWRWAFYINIPDRHHRDPDDYAVRGRSAVHQECEARQDRRHRPRTAGRVAGRAADHPRQRAGRRLVRRDLDSLDGAAAGGHLHRSSSSAS